MSISTLQEKIFNKGCGSVFMVVAALAMGVTFFTGQCNTAARMDAQQGGPNGGGTPVATVGDVPVSGEQIQAMAGQMHAEDVPMQAFALVQATGGALQQAALRALLAKGPVVTSEEVEKAVSGELDQKIEGVRGQLTSTGKLKPGASDADFEKALASQLQGKTLAQFRAQNVADAKKAFADPATTASVVGQFASPILLARYSAKASSDDQSLRDSFKTYVVKRIFFSDRSGSSEPAAKRAEKAAADLKGGASFDALMDSVSNDPGTPTHKPHDVTTPYPADLLASHPELSELKGKTPPATTGVVDVEGGKAIFQLAAVQDSLPKDFEKDKEKYRRQRATSGAQQSLQRDLQALLDKDVKWQSSGFHALAAAAEGMFNPQKSAAAIDLARAALKDKDDAEHKRGALALLAVTQKGSPERMEALETAQANGFTDGSLSLELAKLYGEKKDGAKATDALLAASKANARYDAAGQRLFGDIAGAAIDLQKRGILTAAQLTQIQTQQYLWSSARADNEKAEAEAKKQAAAAEKANQEELARQKAEADKSAPKTATAPPAATSMPPTSTTAGASPLPTPPGGKSK